MMWRNEHSTIKGLAAGAIGGLVGSWVMGYVHAALASWAQPAQQRREEEQTEHGSNARRQQQKKQRKQEGGGEDATVKTAVAISENVFDHQLEPEEKKTAGSHYAFGATMGGLYGMAAEEWRPARWGEGTLFGAVLWFGSDEIAVPALKLAKPPQEYALEVHLGALASHLVYGFTTEMVRRALRSGALSK